MHVTPRRRSQGGVVEVPAHHDCRRTAGRIAVYALVGAIALGLSSRAASAVHDGTAKGTATRLHTATAKGKPKPRPHPYRGRVGAASAMIWYHSAEQLVYLKRARRGGLSWVREDFPWGAFERRPGRT